MNSLKDVSLVTAMVTPFDDEGAVSTDRLAGLIEHLLKSGTQAILVGGTTGEGPTLSVTEKLALFKATVRLVAGRVPIIANTGSNNTAATIEFTKQAAAIAGISAALVVVPYYNKPNQAGLYAHFAAVSEQGGLPILIYNIPARTGVALSVATALRLSLLPNVIGIKDCTGITNLAALVEGTQDHEFYVFTGEDEYALAAKTIGAQGVVSVSSHLYGRELNQMYTDLANGQISAAAAIMRQLIPKSQQLFAQPSPGPVKVALAHVGVPVGGVRLPLVLPDKVEQERLLNILDL
ncbi:4-hydroxy-tetrahydrodipicolinate synthase [Loigolactobacillus jiayinensis]|uniref:4-hydroxy-tetrahydrodipicolinate synthase n=1 Tax=Loigolactobacillus jiayinensis TaxID=2486016 RepID=A0ABW1RHU9_9LACO|nr:4-hydroxy-tetrahydrodipicolinate synthase [Loigolactobacillus jiayinensis]